jgi:hypothetical protein
MSHLATPEFKKLFEKSPLYSKDNIEDPVVITKLFDAFGSATWFLTEYSPDENIAFGFVTGLCEDEWGYISLEELEAINHPTLDVHRIVRDLYFTPTIFSELKFIF